MIVPKVIAGHPNSSPCPDCMKREGCKVSKCQHPDACRCRGVCLRCWGSSRRALIVELTRGL